MKELFSSPILYSICFVRSFFCISRTVSLACHIAVQSWDHFYFQELRNLVHNDCSGGSIRVLSALMKPIQEILLSLSLQNFSHLYLAWQYVMDGLVRASGMLLDTSQQVQRWYIKHFSERVGVYHLSSWALLWIQLLCSEYVGKYHLEYSDLGPLLKTNKQKNK